MGLDMYLRRYPRYKDFAPKQFDAVTEYIGWKKGDQKYTFEEWCGIKESDLPAEEDIKNLSAMAGERFYAWDEKHRHPETGIAEHVGYWRKANAIHKWFVDHIQDGIDDCEYHREVTMDDLMDLKEACAAVLESAVLVNGKVINGYRWTGTKEEPIYQDGKIVMNPEVCKRVLPTTDGFFFGNTEYNEWYLDDVKYTYELCCKLLAETDFETQQIWYISSW